jgi:hypothetical protein
VAVCAKVDDWSYLRNYPRLKPTATQVTKEKLKETTKDAGKKKNQRKFPGPRKKKSQEEIFKPTKKSISEVLANNFPIIYEPESEEEREENEVMPKRMSIREMLALREK